MKKEESFFIPETRDQKHELTLEARRIIGLFQEARKASGEFQKTELLREFCNHLMRAVTPKNEEYFNISDEEIAAVVLNNKLPQYLSVGSGTAGERIYFKNCIIVEKGKDPRKYGADLELTDFGELESADGKPRWMWYSNPELPRSFRYQERFIKNFGDTKVDLLQPLENDK